MKIEVNIDPEKVVNYFNNLLKTGTDAVTKVLTSLTEGGLKVVEAGTKIISEPAISVKIERPSQER